MLFNTAEFLVFFAIVLTVYRMLPHRGQNLMLLAASYLFYAAWDWRFVSLLALSTFVDYATGLAIGSQGGRRTPLARAALVVSLVTNLGILGFFKYDNFFIDSAEGLIRAAGYDGSLWTLQIILPVGISFYTFQSMSYTIDVYRGESPPTRSFVDFALYVSFFPQLVAGPIERATALLPQIQRPRHATRQDIEQGTLLFVLGFFRKVAIADPAGNLADQYFATPGDYTTVPLVAGLVLYAFQIYNDFAGYSDMARGCARILGFTLMRNFRHPYFATSFSDFWRRWHISLSTWLRDYLYIALGGNRRGRVRTSINLMLTMLLGGLWHGANWTFVVWGGLHGTYLSLQRRAPAIAGATGWLTPPPFVRRAAASGMVFAAVCLTWVFFRAADFPTAAAYLGGIAALTPGAEGALLPPLFFMGLTWAIDIPQAVTDDQYVFLRWPLVPQVAAAAAAVFVLLISGATHAPFIYFQF